MNYFNVCPSPLCDFLEYLETIKGKSNKTVNEYFLDLRIFYRFLAFRYNLTNDANFDDIDIYLINEDILKKIKLNDLHSFISHVDKVRNNANRTKARKVASLRSYFNYLTNVIKVLSENPALNLETPKTSIRHPVYLTLYESKTLLESISGQNQKRDFAIIILFLNCGMRLSELTGINIDNFKEDTLTVIGKGNKERTIYLNNSCIEALTAYIEVRPEAKKNHEKALFLSNRKQRISQKAVQHLVKKHLGLSGLDRKKYSPHKLRHTAATLMYKYGDVDIRALQEILGHENVSTTQIYTHIDNERLRKAVSSNPLSNYKINNSKELSEHLQDK